jgi:hypothetical protein
MVTSIFNQKLGMTDMNCIVAGRRGNCVITLKDGTTYEFFYPTIMFHDYMTAKRMCQFYNKKGTFSGLKDVTNGLTCCWSMPDPDRSWTGWAGSFIWGKKKENELFKQCLIELMIYVEAGGPKASVISTGFANYVCLVAWGESVYWRYNDKGEKWDCSKDGLNSTPESVLQTPYVQMIKDKEYGKLDSMLAERQNNTK